MKPLNNICYRIKWFRTSNNTNTDLRVKISLTSTTFSLDRFIVKSNTWNITFSVPQLSATIFGKKFKMCSIKNYTQEVVFGPKLKLVILCSQAPQLSPKFSPLWAALITMYTCYINNKCTLYLLFYTHLVFVVFYCL